jgi:hypothetical protein
VTPGPIALSPAQEADVKAWAADDRLWTTQETVEFNLRVFATRILALSLHDRLALAHLTAARDSYKRAFEQLRDHGILLTAPTDA